MGQEGSVSTCNMWDRGVCEYLLGVGQEECVYMCVFNGIGRSVSKYKGWDRRGV